MLKKGLVSLGIVFSIFFLIRDYNFFEIEEKIITFSNYRECNTELVIDKINLKECLYNIEDENNSLEVGLEILYEDPLVIAGHSGTGKLALFNRLNELLIGDVIKVNNDIYKVVEIDEKSKTAKLRVKEDLVLVTCIVNTDKQLVLYAKLT